MTYEEAIEWLFGALPVWEQRGAGAYKPGLERVREFLGELGDPQTKFSTVHIAGTNGKGSTSHMLAAVLQAAGYRTGLFTSPHLLDFRERVRVDGKMIEEEMVVDFTKKHQERMAALGLTFFEMTTALAFAEFARSGVDVAVIETGLGGRLDSTNIITPLVSVITNIGLEHTQYLGNTIPLIASEKAGIIKPNVPVVIGQTDAESTPVFEARARWLDAPIVFADQIYRVIKTFSESGKRVYDMAGANNEVRRFALDLAGDYQRLNLPTILATVDVLRHVFNISEDAISHGLAHAAYSTGLAGRWQVLRHRPLVVCDTAHNAHGFEQVAHQIASQSYHTLYMVLGFVADKDLSAIIPLLPHDAHYILTQPSVGRAMPVDESAYLFAEQGIVTETTPTVSEAVQKALSQASSEDMIYVGGSNFVVAEVLPLFENLQNC
jgi:dihydrofolate synthase/folylpolyglutamate synthase